VILPARSKPDSGKVERWQGRINLPPPEMPAAPCPCRAGQRSGLSPVRYSGKSPDWTSRSVTVVFVTIIAHDRRALFPVATNLRGPTGCVRLLSRRFRPDVAGLRPRRSESGVAIPPSASRLSADQLSWPCIYQTVVPAPGLSCALNSDINVLLISDEIMSYIGSSCMS
jgi:hypothetical protein